MPEAIVATSPQRVVHTGDVHGTIARESAVQDASCSAVAEETEYVEHKGEARHERDAAGDTVHGTIARESASQDASCSAVAEETEYVEHKGEARHERDAAGDTERRRCHRRT